ncbi:hypothetical protein SDC9_04271 [bioreactor metagenome]|uniref:Uncharacterized protein n=1 Tax=bioreactor metagenome TaxID=1076179 RepID=A0A644SVK0_9ZZZZ|nr:hypothetical protein [Negativicutes bacterium]
MAVFTEIPSDELAGLSLIIAIWVSKILTIEELNVFGNFIVAVGSIILTIAAQEEALKTKMEEPEEDIKKQIKELEKKMNLMQERIGL